MTALLKLNTLSADLRPSLICNGILDTYGDNFSVTAGGDLSVVMGTGKAWIGGHYFINDMAYTLDLRQYTVWNRLQFRHLSNLLVIMHFVIQN